LSGSSSCSGTVILGERGTAETFDLVVCMVDGCVLRCWPGLAWVSEAGR
jgi:hypothetical protein